MRAIVVCSARGGAGKTTVAVQLARALEGLGERTVLVDLDPTGPGTAALAPVGAGEGPSLAAALTGQWRGRAGDLVRAGATGPAVIPAVGLGDVAAVLSAGAETRLRSLVVSLMGDGATVVVDCPGGPVGRVGPFTAVALAAIAPLATSGGGVLAVMTPSGPEVDGTARLLARVPPGAVLGLVVNGVGETAIGASLHDLGRRLGVPVLARIPAVGHVDEVAAIGSAVDQLARLLVSEPGATAAWSALWRDIDGSARRDEDLVRRLQVELDRLAREPWARPDPELGLGLVLLGDTPARDHLVRRWEEVAALMQTAPAAPPEPPAPAAPPAPPADPERPGTPETGTLDAAGEPDARASLHDRLSRLAPWAAHTDDDANGSRPH